MTTSTRKNFLLCLALLGLSAVSLSAQSNTVPAGYFTVSVPGGTVSSPGQSLISFPLQDTATAAGQMVGLVTAVTANTVTNSGAGWTAGQLSVASTPYLIQFTSGAAAGRTFLISTSTTNSATTLTIDATDASTTDLTTLNIVAGTDTYQIIPADTISSVFGTPATTGVVDASSAAQADNIQLFNSASGVYLSYYYNTTSGWLKTGIPQSATNIVIRPDTGVIYIRRGAALNLTLMGRVPTVPRQTAVTNNGQTILSNIWPTDMGLGATASETINGTPVTLAPSNIQNIPGWVKGTLSVADTVQVFTSGGVWLTYYHNGTNWVKTGIPQNGDSVIIPAGTAVILSKKNPTTGQNILSEALPYSL